MIDQRAARVAAEVEKIGKRARLDEPAPAAAKSGCLNRVDLPRYIVAERSGKARERIALARSGRKVSGRIADRLTASPR